MPTSRRTFLKTSLAAGAVTALPALPAFGVDPQRAVGFAATVNSDPTSSFTLGLGNYPGAPGENFAPHFTLDTTTYRNLALLRPATHSSAYDYNLTAQLVTDGVKATTPPRWIVTSTSTDGILPIEEREHLVDHWPAYTIELHGAKPWIQIELGGGGPDVPTIDRLKVFVVMPQQVSVSALTFIAQTSDDGSTWKDAGQVVAPAPINPGTDWPPDLIRGTNLFYPSIPLTAASQSRFYRLRMELAGVPAEQEQGITWRVGQIEFYHGRDDKQNRVEIGGPYSFTSAWRSAGSGEEWVAIDLGARCTFDKIGLFWIARAAEGSLQISDDAQTWRELHPLPANTTDLTDTIHLAAPARARYLRVHMTRPASPDGYMLSEIEVYGRGGPIPVAKPAQQPTPEGKLVLSGGNWRVQREPQVESPGVALSRPGYNDADWVVATVPATTLVSYLNAGALPDPNFGDNQLYLSDSFFYADFWYRNEFTAPVAPASGNQPGQLQWLHFDGINWKAEIFLNGEHLGRIDGGFMRGVFDVTGKLRPGQPNALAVRVLREATPGSTKQKTFESPGPNGGAPGADNPTYHSSIGWDWIPTIRGRNTGIWGDVFLTQSGPVTLENPLVLSTLPLPSTASAEVTIEVEATNHTASPVRGTLRGSFGDTRFEQSVALDANAKETLKLKPLHLDNPRLWQPAGYGDPHLYDVTLTFEASGQPSDKKTFKAGIRQMTATEDGGALRLFINGRRFIPKGGNWGFSESMLRYRAREYDAAVRYHREMNFTMIRNWVGQIGDNAFFEACDRHGIVVWQDFWLANPWDGPVPNDNALFLANTRDTILRIRHHASIGLYVGRNEGYPPPALDQGIRTALAEYHPDIHYIGSSADGVVSGHGPYRALAPTYYFEHADHLFHSEIGAPNIPPLESVELFMNPAQMWPQALTWGLHDFCLNGAQGGRTFRETIDDGYGGAHSAEEWITLAQFVNYEVYRAMFEAQSKYRMGLLLWMSHPCWPSFVWQTYDFYFEPTAAYFGCKKACEPLHIQWNRATNMAEVVNLSAGNIPNLTARAELFNLDGSAHGSQTATLTSSEDSVHSVFALEFPAGLSAVHFLRLTLSDASGVRSTNLYLRGRDEGNLRQLRTLPRVKLQASTATERKGDVWLLTTTLKNITSAPAVFVRLKAVRETSGDRILPAIYSDNYLTLLPGETRTITTELNHADTRNERPRIALTGFNTIPATV